MKITVIYHSADFDGIFCREIARHFIPYAEFIGWNFGDPLIAFPKQGTVYVLDLSPDCLAAQVPNPPNTDCKSRMIWIDHHKTSIEKWATDIPGYRIDGVAACRLAWQWFTRPAIDDGATPRLPQKQEFIDHAVHEPLAVRLAGEYDIWDKRDPRAETFQYGLRTVDPEGAIDKKDTESPHWWSELLSGTEEFNHAVAIILGQGGIAQRYAQKTDASICNHRTWLMEWEGLKFLCVNSAQFNSLFFVAKDIPETGHDALLGFCFNGKIWTVSLYHAKHRKDLDLSEIAKKHGGGGHRGACGFTAKALPFTL